jgi:hypothetical protein
MADDKDIKQYPWETWSPETKAKMKEVIRRADKAMYAQQVRKSGAPVPVSAESQKIFQDTLKAGGLAPEISTLLGRYKQYLTTTGDDPDWQGPLQINDGPRDTVDTPADIEARNASWYSDPDGRGALIGEASSKNYRQQENRYDGLVNPKLLKPYLEGQQAPVSPPVANDAPKITFQNTSESKKLATEPVTKDSFEGMGRALLKSLMNIGGSK